MHLDQLTLLGTPVTGIYCMFPPQNPNPWISNPFVHITYGHLELFYSKQVGYITHLQVLHLNNLGALPKVTVDPKT